MGVCLKKEIFSFLPLVGGATVAFGQVIMFGLLFLFSFDCIDIPK